MSNYSEPSFFIKSTENSFADRQKNIFDQLNLVDKQTKQSSSQNELDDIPQSISSDKSEGRLATARPNRRETRQFRGKESIFKRPEALPPRFKSRDIPDYQRHPDKWTKYTLGDVSKDDMSERSNIAAAMTFLDELASRKNATEMDNKDLNDKIKFKPRKKADSCNVVEEICGTSGNEKGAFRSSKLVMPEYVVGREQKRSLKRVSELDETIAKKKTKEIKLSHLDEEDE